MKLKTLKDLDHPVLDQMGKEAYTRTGLVDTNELKAEVVKWIKEERDIRQARRRHEFDFLTEEERWMQRFNITEEDLK